MIRNVMLSPIRSARNESLQETISQEFDVDVQSIHHMAEVTTLGSVLFRPCLQAKASDIAQGSIIVSKTPLVAQGCRTRDLSGKRRACWHCARQSPL
ncbi:unnamed protein product [Caenorhabditis auriculariae]|uniref:Uncharacterized protein n=1 Tax=Caenorhabditis auriculariae TaxID=2777116 RepID=A0A8S1HRZ1_9PELO|nr:unnamed protein product [Caenorhabditis auriculariae]